jgi:hypothetical protein
MDALERVNERINTIIDAMEADHIDVADQLIVLQAAYAFVLADHAADAQNLEAMLDEGLELTREWARTRFVEVENNGPEPIPGEP